MRFGAIFITKNLKVPKGTKCCTMIFSERVKQCEFHWCTEIRCDSILQNILKVPKVTYKCQNVVCESQMVCWVGIGFNFENSNTTCIKRVNAGPFFLGYA